MPATFLGLEKGEETRIETWERRFFGIHGEDTIKCGSQRQIAYLDNVALQCVLIGLGLPASAACNNVQQIYPRHGDATSPSKSG
ncbi:MAG: hypothetical protein R3C68_04910 [Myxococcota bacterium]